MHCPLERAAPNQSVQHKRRRNRRRADRFSKVCMYVCVYVCLFVVFGMDGWMMFLGEVRCRAGPLIALAQVVGMKSPPMAVDEITHTHKRSTHLSALCSLPLPPFASHFKLREKKQTNKQTNDNTHTCWKKKQCMDRPLTLPMSPRKCVWPSGS